MSESILTKSASDTPMYSITQMPSGQIASAVNNNGQVAGSTSYSPGAESRPVVWNSSDVSSTTVAPMEADEFSLACAINDAGEIVGAFNSDVAIAPYIWTSGAVEGIPLPADAVSGGASGINTIGDVVGHYCGEKGRRAFLWRRGHDVQELAPLAADSFSYASAINDAGKVVGTSGNAEARRAVLWGTAELPEDLGTLPGDISSQATGINVTGLVVGHSDGPKGRRAFLWDRATGMQDLKFLANGAEAEALAVNDSGTVVGTCSVAGEGHAFIWTAQNGMQDLNQQIPSDFKVVLVGAHAINNKGQSSQPLSMPARVPMTRDHARLMNARQRLNTSSS